MAAATKICFSATPCPGIPVGIRPKPPAAVAGGLLVLFDFLLIFCAGFMIGGF